MYHESVTLFNVRKILHFLISSIIKSYIVSVIPWMK